MSKTLVFLSLFTLLSCASYDLKIKDESHNQIIDFEDDEIANRLILIGDTGNSIKGNTTDGLKGLESYILNEDRNAEQIIILGDNIYPNGMPLKDHSTRSEAEARARAQLNVFQKFDGDVIFLPGNHDWRNGIPGLIEQKEYMEDYTDNDSSFHWEPEIGCGMSGEDLSDALYLLTIDSEWFLQKWDKNPQINRNCPRIKTRQQFIDEFATELKKNQNKTVLVAMHHPLHSNGIHGGKYELTKHLFPAPEKIPLPILGSLANAIRANGGISRQDIQNELYRSLVNQLEKYAEQYENVIFAAGHEHNLQYIEAESTKQIISGSGSKISFAQLGRYSEFAYPGQGFAELTVLKNGASYVRFYKAENDTATPVFQKQINPPNYLNQEINYEESDAEFITKAIYDDVDLGESKSYKSILGQHYRELYLTPIEYKTVKLDTLYGGLTPIQLGGGDQTNSLRLEDKKGRQYNIRQIRKDAVRLLQSNVYEDQYLKDEFDHTIIENLLEDIMTTSHPFAFLTVPVMAKEIGVYHTNPKLFYIPKQKALGKFNKMHGNSVYMIEERPEDHWLGTDFFGSPNHDIVSTRKFYGHLKRDAKYKVDEKQYIKSRIFDILIGDFDRHGGQWRWAETKTEYKTHIFSPIPRDRDQVFANFDGGFFDLVRLMASFPKSYQEFSEDIDYYNWYSFNARSQDRNLLRNSSKEDWMDAAEYIQKNITDDVIERAFAEMPEEVKGEVNEQLKKTFKKRRDNIVSMISKFYDVLAEYVVVIATNKDDFIDLEFLEDDRVKLKIYRNKKGERKKLFVENTYSDVLTKEVWIYGLDDDDVFTVKGENKSKLKFRLIGGHGHDTFDVGNQKQVIVHDYKSSENTFNLGSKARQKLTDDYEENVFLREKTVHNTRLTVPQLGYNPDDGFLIGGLATFRHKGFYGEDYSTQHIINAGFYFGTKSYNLSYEFAHADLVGDFNGFARASYKSPSFARNFFGFGNESENNDSALGKSYNRVRLRDFEASIGLRRESKYGSFYELSLNYNALKIKRTSDRYIDAIGNDFEMTDEDFFSNQNFLDLTATYQYEGYDDKLAPAKGMNFKVDAGFTHHLSSSDHFYSLEPSLEFFNPLSRSHRLVLRTQVQSQLRFKNDFNFYHAAHLGADSGLRAYRRERFTGKQTLVGNADVRYAFNEIHTSFLPIQLGVFGGADLGRVWIPNQDSSKWHNSYGGGMWINAAELVSGQFNLFHGKDGFHFSFGLTTKF